MWFGSALIASDGKSQANLALTASSSERRDIGGSPSQPPSSVFAAIGEVQKPMYRPRPCQRWWARHRGDLDEPRVHPGQVVVLHEVLGDELPVRVDLVLDPPDEALLGEPVAVESLGKIAELVVERGRLGVEAHEDEAAPFVDANGVKTVVGPVERLDLAHVEDVLLILGNPRFGREERCSQTRSVEVVRPRVVGALEEARDLALPLRDEPRPAVAADIVVRAKLAVAVPAHDERAAADLDDDERARLAYLVREADGHPGRAEDALAFQRRGSPRRCRRPG